MTPAELFERCPEQQIAPLSHGRLSYRDTGQGPPIVFLHGLLGNARSWAWQFHLLSNRFRVIAWDAPGYGQSDVVDQSLDAFAETLWEFLNHLKCDKVNLVGHSMGGVVAAALAARHPDLVSHLVLSCTHPGYAEPADTPPTEKLQSRLRDLETMGPEAYGQVRARNMVAAGATEAAIDIASLVAAETGSEGLFCATRMLQFADARPLYSTLPMPVLVLNGTEDPVVKPAMKQELLRLTPSARHEDLPSVGHAPYLEDPEKYSQILTSFIGGE